MDDAAARGMMLILADILGPEDPHHKILRRCATDSGTRGEIQGRQALGKKRGPYKKRKPKWPT